MVRLIVPVWLSTCRPVVDEYMPPVVPVCVTVAVTADWQNGVLPYEIVAVGATLGDKAIPL